MAWRIVVGLLLLGCATALRADSFEALLLKVFDHPGAQTFDGFGKVLTIEEDLLAVGMPDDGSAGKVFVFRRNQGGNADAWFRIANLDFALEEGAEFGTAVAMDGNVLVVGAPKDDLDFGDPNPTGLVFVFRREDNGAFRRVLALGREAEDSERVGTAVAVCGDLFVVGAPGRGGGRGRSYIYRYRSVEGEGAELLGVLEGPAGQTSSFGQAVAIEGDTVFVGAPFYDSNANQQAGAVFVFKQDYDPANPATPTANHWGLRETLLPNDTAFARVGGTLAVGGGVLAVGDEFGDTAGKVHLYRRDLGGLTADDWPFLKALSAPGGVTRFGRALDFAADQLVVGANSAATVFGRNQGGADAWGVVEHLAGEAGTPSFGQAVAYSAGVLVVGAPERFTTEEPGGAVFAYAIEPESWSHVQTVSPFQIDGGVELAASLDLSGDTLVAGAPAEDAGAGAVYVFRRNRVFNDPTPRVSDSWGEVAKLFPPVGAAPKFGHAVAIFGDRIAVSTVQQNDGEPSSAVYIYERNYEAIDPGDSFADSWNLRATVNDPVNSLQNHFGSNISLFKNLLAVSDEGDRRCHLFRPKLDQIGVWELIHNALRPGTADLPDGLPVAVYADAMACRSSTGVDLRIGSSFWDIVYSAGSTTAQAPIALSASYFAYRQCNQVSLRKRSPILLDPVSNLVDVMPPQGFVGEFATSLDLAGNQLLVASKPSEAPCASATLYGKNQGGADAWAVTKHLYSPRLFSEASDFGSLVALDGNTAVVATRGSQRVEIYQAGESPYLIWLRSHFSAEVLNNPALEALVWGPGADPDADLIPNLIEFILLFSPNVPDAEIGFETQGRVAEGFIRRLRGDVGLCIEWSTDLVEWRSVQESDSSTFEMLVEDQGERQRCRITVTNADERYFFRYRAFRH